MKFSWKKNKADSSMEPLVTDRPAVASRPTDFEYKVYSLCETGPTRTSNEDAVCSSYPDGSYQCLFAMVADGMGGHNAGEVASGMACDVLKSWVQQNYGAPDAGKMLAEGIEKAHETILTAAADNERMQGMGTTSTALFIRNRAVHYAHVGDSRLYHASGKEWRQVTTDHTVVNQLVMSGELSAEEAGRHPMKNVITQAVGYTRSISPETGTEAIPVHLGDRFLLISDGVYDVLSGDELGALVSIRHPHLLLECVASLCTTRRSSDNFSVLLITVSDELLPVLSITKEQNAVL